MNINKRIAAVGRLVFLSVLSALLLPVSVSAGVASEEPSVVISIKDHKFDTERVEIPAGQRVKLIVKNLDPTPEEFESDDLGIEKIILGRMQTTVYVGPLEPGEYVFFGEFHLDTAQGLLIVR